MFYYRFDTLFGSSFLALSVDHPLSKHFVNDQNFLYLKNVMKLELQKNAANAEKIGFKTELTAINLDQNIEIQFILLTLF